MKASQPERTFRPRTLMAYRLGGRPHLPQEVEAEDLECFVAADEP